MKSAESKVRLTYKAVANHTFVPADARANEQLAAARAELEAIERGDSTADRWQVEQRIRHAENQLSVAGR